MKALGMLLIVYGHFFSLHANHVYVFSVPVFFVISGFLCRREDSSAVFWKKLFFNLILPMIIICSINFLINSAVGYITDGNVPTIKSIGVFTAKLMAGIQGAVGTFWFVYTLAILKIILQFTRRAYCHIIIFIVCLLSAYYLNNSNVCIYGKPVTEISCSAINTFVAYPFFIIGFYLKNYKRQINEYMPNSKTLLLFIVCTAIVYYCGHNHKTVFMYICGYGDDLLLFLLGGMAGTMLLFFISKVLNGLRFRTVRDIAVGSIVILGFHMHLVRIALLTISKRTIADSVFSILIVLILVPIIRFAEKHTPVIMGKYRITH